MAEGSGLAEGSEDAVDAPSASGQGRGERRARRGGLGLMLGLSAGHCIQHFCDSGLLLLLPHIRQAMALSDPAMGAIVGVRTVASGVTNVPAGIMTDMYRRRVALMLVGSMSCLALGYLVIGLALHYWVVLLAVTVAGVGTSLWHAPAFSTLSARYPERRGLAMALNFSGGATGDAVAPFIVGILLGGVSFWGLNWGGFGWRTVAFLNVVPAALAGSSLLAFLRSGAVAAPRPADFKQYVSSVLPLLKNGPVMGVVGLFALRGMVHQSFSVYLVLYLKEQLGYTDFVTGLHISLLTLLGVIASPIMGRISDRSGRHKVIFAAMLVAAALIFCFAFAKSGIPLVILLALIGAVIFPVGSVMSAAALDATPTGVEGSTVAVMFSGGMVIGAAAPVLAGLINQSWGFEGVTLFAGTIAVCCAVVAVLVPTGTRVESTGNGSARRG